MSLDFDWIGESISVDFVDKQLTAKPKTFYRQCKYQGVVYTVGDDVMISNSEADDPESVMDCYVASIIHMYEMKANKKDPFRAQVQWYSRVPQLGKRIRTLPIEPPLDEKWELIREGTRYEGDISIETIFNQASIITTSADSVPESEVGKRGKKFVFFCRFALDPKLVRGALVPINAAAANSSKQDTPSAKKGSPEDVLTPRSRRARPVTAPSRYLDETLPSPIKNSTFSVKKSKELSLVIQRCDKVLVKSESDNDNVKIKARKKLDLEEEYTPQTKTPRKTPAKKSKENAAVTPSTGRRLKSATPSLSTRSDPLLDAASPMAEVRRKLHVSAVPDALPCREDEFSYIYNFVEGKLADGSGGCMYVSGVPGTGKTATVTKVVELLRSSQEEGALPDFKLVQVNGMKLTTPQQIYVQIWSQLTGSKVSADAAVKLLHAKFSSNGPRHLPTVLIVDELDLLWTRQQDVLYNIFEWPTRSKAQLTVLAIANTMDLPERMLLNKVASRMGLTRLIFQPYKVKQLQTIITSRLENCANFEPESIEFIARKVSAASGDARRALDISRRAAELAESQDSTATTSNKRSSAAKKAVTIQHVHAAIEEMFSSPKLLAIQACSLQEQIFLNALVQEYHRTGVEESHFYQVIRQHFTLCDLESVARPSVSQLLSVCASLNSSRLILSEHGRNDIRQKLHLNISIDDVTYALNNRNQ